jgi:hypothetical protein
MKHPTLLALAVVLASCAKDPRSVTYDVSCHNCAIDYITEANVYEHVYLGIYPEYTTTELDTTIAGVDTTLTLIDTVFVGGPFAWSYTFTASEDVNPQLRVVQRADGSQPLTASRTIDGMREERTVAYRNAVATFP